MKRKAPSDSKLKTAFMPVYLAAMGIALVIFGANTGIDNISAAQNDKRLIAEGSSTVGEIVDVQLKIKHGKHSSSEKIFTVEYTDSSGKIQSLTESEVYRSGEEGPLEKVSNEWEGKKVNIFYDANDPSNSVVEDWKDSMSMAVSGLVFLEVVGAALIVFSVMTTRSILAESREKKRTARY